MNNTQSGASALVGKNYEFNIAFGTDMGVDVAVKNVVGYKNQNQVICFKQIMKGID